MKSLHRNRRNIYLCKVYRDGTIKKYEEPILLKENWASQKPASTFIPMGLDAYEYVRIRTTKAHAKYYHLGDRAYIQVSPPDEHDIYCKTADFEVCKDPIVSINECEVMFKRLSGQNSKNIF